MHDAQTTKQLTLTAVGPLQMTDRLLTFQRALRARSGMLVEVRWSGTQRAEFCEVSVTYSLPC